LTFGLFTLAGYNKLDSTKNKIKIHTSCASKIRFTYRHRPTNHSITLQQFTSNTKTKMSSSGSREVLDAARKRLASAKSQVSAASQHMKAVMASAQTMCDAADKEYKEAKAALEEAETKYEVIDIDDDDSGCQTTDEDKAAWLKQLKDDIAKREAEAEALLELSALPPTC